MGVSTAISKKGRRLCWRNPNVCWTMRGKTRKDICGPWTDSGGYRVIIWNKVIDSDMSQRKKERQVNGWYPAHLLRDKCCGAYAKTRNPKLEGVKKKKNQERKKKGKKKAKKKGKKKGKKKEEKKKK